VNCVRQYAHRRGRVGGSLVASLIAPLGQEAALQAITDRERDGTQRPRQIELALEHGRVMKRARSHRQYDAVDPENRLRSSPVTGDRPVLQSLLHALFLFREFSKGFRSGDLREQVATLSGCDPAAISQGAVTFQLRRLRLHRLIVRVPTSFRYEVTDFGLRVGLFYTRVYNRVLRPGLAAAVSALRAINSPLRRALEAIAAKIDAIIKDAQLATQNFTHLPKVSCHSSSKARRSQFCAGK
jgi:hypothetical protein